jgi:hypothetical protein
MIRFLIFRVGLGSPGGPEDPQDPEGEKGLEGEERMEKGKRGGCLWMSISISSYSGMSCGLLCLCYDADGVGITGTFYR